MNSEKAHDFLKHDKIFISTERDRQDLRADYDKLYLKTWIKSLILFWIQIKI